MSKHAKARREAEDADAAAQAEAEEYRLPVTEFDEQEFLRKEALSAKATYAAAVLGLVCGVVSFILLSATGEWRLGLLVVAAGLFGMKPLFVRLGVMAVEDKKALFGNGFLVVAAWLGLFILTANPPFGG